MSRHSKNNTSSSVFTYAQKQKLKGVYGTKNERISQDSIKKFEMCTLCSNRIIEPRCCDKGHIFCRDCVVEYLVRQKKKIAEQNDQYEKEKKKQQIKECQKQMEEDIKRIEKFEKHDNFLDLAQRSQTEQPKEKKVQEAEIKPTGMYEQNSSKVQYVKTSFWAIQNTPVHSHQSKKVDNVVKCPGSDHKLTLKKLREVKCKEIQGGFCCWVCCKEIGRQRVGMWKCGHLLCKACKSQHCEVCTEKDGWIDVESSASSFASHQHAEVKTYTHAFYV